MPANDVVFLKGLALTAIVGPDTWHRRKKPQPVILDLRMKSNIELAADTDDVLQTIHYGNLCKSVTKVVSNETLTDVIDLATRVHIAALGPRSGELELTVMLPKALLLADGIGYCTSITKDGDVITDDRSEPYIFVQNMKLACVIGVNSHERLEKQYVVINLRFYQFQAEFLTNYAEIIKAVSDGVEKSSYETLETLATFIGRIVCTSGKVLKVTISVQKPSALMFVEGSGVEITRDAAFYQDLEGK